MAELQNLTVPSSDGHFVNSVISRCKIDNGVRAALKKADNPATEYMCWDYLASFGINLEHDDRRLPYVTVGAAIGRVKPDRNGSIAFGKALASSYDEGSDSKPAIARIRRLLACSDVSEVCVTLRPMLSLIASKISLPLNYIRLLSQIKRFPLSPEIVKAQWAQEFYSYAGQKDGKQ
ncbi:type I-E CRISPR-associated protein Cse2/CasB (plasmid) [Pseudomonas silesiensis]|uniref:type I-E CRISPR-associated protein Cse2/CasB n=1 Tax=Pseudomonas silesiensis TaxID=1853130 RepID=UPI0030D1D1F6